MIWMPIVKRTSGVTQSPYNLLSCQKSFLLWGYDSNPYHAYQLQPHPVSHSPLFLACQPLRPFQVLQMHHAVSDHGTFKWAFFPPEMSCSLHLHQDNTLPFFRLSPVLTSLSDLSGYGYKLSEHQAPLPVIRHHSYNLTFIFVIIFCCH